MNRSFFISVIVISCLALASALFTSGSVQAQSYVEPGATSGTTVVPPAANNIAPPLNSSNSIQRKLGTLLVGPSGGTAVLCLNATYGSTLDNSNPDCVSSWSSLATQIGGPFVRLSTCTPGAVGCVAGAANNPSTYVSDNGFARIQASDYRHLFSTIIYAPNVAGQTTYGLYATDGTANGDSASNFAGYFAGKFYVQSGNFCLNGTSPAPSTYCISSWDQIAGGGAGIVTLQANPTAGPVAQTGGAAVTGVAQTGSVIAGDPNAAGLTLPFRYSCGDGLCSGNETAVTCAVDCTVALPQVSGFTIGTVATSANQPNPPYLTFSLTPGGSGSQYLLIVRGDGVTPTFTPIAGARYTVGQVFGNATVVYANFVTGGSVATGTLDSGYGLSGHTYYYAAFQGNTFPRFNMSPVVQSIDIVWLDFSVSNSSYGYVQGPNSGFITSYGYGGAASYFPRNSTVTLTAYPLPGHTVSFWSSSDPGGFNGGTTNVATITMSQDVAQFAGFSGGVSGCPPNCGIGGGG